MTGFAYVRVLALVVATMALAMPTLAQTSAQSQGSNPSGQQTQVEPGALQVPVAVEDAAPVGPELLVEQSRRGVRPPPLGSDIFRGRPPEVNNQIVSDGYVMKPGDKVRVTLWGLVEEDQELTVDTQGNILVPGVGPVQIAGLTANQVGAAVETAGRQVYSEGVQIYAAPEAAASVQVLVTGPVARPGAYAGASDDALVVYLQRAGGIVAERGSYRRIRVVRDGRTIAEADLYAFLKEGVSPPVMFRNGDAIVVGEQGAAISVSGDVRAPFTFELGAAVSQGAELMQYARPRPGATHAAIVGVRNNVPYSDYLPLDVFSRTQLHDGDRVQFESDSRAPEILVRVEGAHDGPSVFSEARGATVASVLSQVTIDENADRETIHLRRESVRRAQKQLIEESLARLERATFTQPARTPAEAAARAQSLTFVTQFIASARRVEPDGILALNDQDLTRVRLESGDVIVIPERSQVVTIAGEVEAPQSVLAQPEQRVRSYVDLAGGFTRRADRGKILVFRQDGRIREGGVVQPGDRILVPTKPDSTLIPLIRDITQTLFQLAGVFLVFDGGNN